MESLLLKEKNLPLTIGEPSPHVLLNQIRRSFESGTKVISINSMFKLTKTEKAFCNVQLLNDISLQEDVFNWIDMRSSHKNIMSRYLKFDSNLRDKEIPKHFPARILSGVGPICSGQNIFLFFPFCLGIDGSNLEDYYGIELIDIWSNIFYKSVFPCSRHIFDYETQARMLSILAGNLDKTIYLASIYHEVGHRVGAWKVSPTSHENLQVSNFVLDVFGEMATDSLLVRNLQEFPEVLIFVTLQRLFWFGRRGFRDNPISAKINQDNDSWLSCLLLNRLTQGGAVLKNEHKWHLDIEKAKQVYLDLTQDIEEIGQKVLKIETAEHQNQLALEWMKNEVEWNNEHGFVLPNDLRQIYSKCLPVEEIPHFTPLVEMNHWESL